MQVSVLLISAREESLWFRNLESVLSALGKFEVMSEEEAMRHIFQEKYELVIVDAAAVSNERFVVSRVYALQHQARIIVITASPTWKRAREVLQAGAMDYISKFLSEEEFLAILKKTLDMTPRSWSKQLSWR